MMGSSLSFAKNLLVPASIALALYILLSFIIVPFFGRYHQRYSQYLPLESISAHTLSLRDRAANAVMRVFLPSTWRCRRGGNDDQRDNISIFDEEGEIMVGMNMDSARRQTLERRQNNPAELEGRLSRDLEEGFMDDSDDEAEGPGNGRIRH